MSNLVEEYVLYDLTKKERVVYLAKKDPFLKVEKIAQLAETTAHYVRTVLSEADLSLTRLRKEYAKKKNKKYTKGRLLDILEIEGCKEVDFSLQDKIILNKSDKYNQILQTGNDLLETTILCKENETPLMLNTLVISSNNQLKCFQDLKDRDDLDYSEPKLNVEIASKDLAKVLKIDEEEPILILGREIYINQELTGLDFCYFIPNRTELLLKGDYNQIEIVKCK